MSLSLTEFSLRVEEPANSANQKILVRRGSRMDIPIKLIKKDNTAYILTGFTVEMDARKEDGTGLFGTNKVLTAVLLTSGQVKLVLDGTFNFDSYPDEDYPTHLRIMNGATIVQEVAESFIFMIRPGTP